MGVLDTTSEATKQTDIDEILGFLASLEKVLPSEKSMKQNLMDNKVYNEYNMEELQHSFSYVSCKSLEPQQNISHPYSFFRLTGRNSLEVYFQGCQDLMKPYWSMILSI